jgi:hypothetical protein
MTTVNAWLYSLKVGCFVIPHASFSLVKKRMKLVGMSQLGEMQYRMT